MICSSQIANYPYFFVSFFITPPINTFNSNSDTIVALATPAGTGGIAVIRLSGNDAFNITDSLFHAKKFLEKPLAFLPSHTLHFGVIKDGDRIIDEVLLSLFIAPHSYTGENVIEISCHGSVFIQEELIRLFIRNGARHAQPGEFTLRAFLNRKLDLSQAEAVADLVASHSQTSHDLALQQMRGGYSENIKTLRSEMINFASLVELELDFGEEDVKFADRNDLKNLVSRIQSDIGRMVNSFELGNVIKNGVPVTIAGKPNAGKSTLLNALLNEERAIVSEIPGTTRDFIEDELNIGGITFRLIDTAGLRETKDDIESIGVSKAFEKMSSSAVIIYLFDAAETDGNELQKIKSGLHEKFGRNMPHLVFAANKIDRSDKPFTKEEFHPHDVVLISAKEKINLNALKDKLVSLVDIKDSLEEKIIVTNTRHYEALIKASAALDKVSKGLEENISGDFLSIDIRSALDYLGTITGEVLPDDLLGTIFSRFCIGK